MARFLKNDIMSLVGQVPRYDLAESVGPDLQLGDLLGDPDAPGLDGLALSYGTHDGDPRLRAVLAESHGVAPDDVVITIGAMQALFLIAFILCDKGDEAVTTSPLFPPATNALKVVGATVRTLPLSFAGGYRIDVAALGAQLSARTKLISLASPQNPSGVAIDHETVGDILAAMAEICPDAYLLVDETYREAVYGDDPIVDSAVGLSPKVVSCASLSKCHGAPGLRLGWAITRDPPLHEQLVLGKFNTVIACSLVDEALALRVLQQRDRIMGDRRQRLADGLSRTADWVAANKGLVDWVRPDAGALCCVRLDPAAFDDTAVGRFYDGLAGDGLRVANGTWFGDEARVFRLGFGFLSTPGLEAALASLTEVLRRTARAAA